jgi:hypothetical protein
MIGASRTTELLRSAWRTARAPVSAIDHWTRERWPTVFGLPVESHLVQLYRADTDVDTQVSLANVLSFFLLEEGLRAKFRIAGYDRQGRLLAQTTHRLDRWQSFQGSLRDLIGFELDEYGAFTIDASYDRETTKQLAKLGQTAPQFMTLYFPRRTDGGQPPQILHSHKRLRLTPSIGSPVEWSSHCLERLSALAALDVFVINIDPVRLHAQIELRAVGSGDCVWRSAAAIPGWGTERFSAPVADFATTNGGLFSLHYRYDRPVSYRRPIIFRRFNSGLITANHS